MDDGEHAPGTTADASDQSDTARSNSDIVIPFQMQPAIVRGRMVRLGPLINQILRQHAYPRPVARLLGEMLTVSALLADSLKFDGIFTLQLKGDGILRMMVTDVTSAGEVRGYAKFDGERLEAAEDTSTPTIRELVGAKAYLAFTVDQGQNTDRYQGIVNWTGETVVDCVHHYFEQSQQIDSRIRVVLEEIRRPGASGPEWRAGGVLLQRLPHGDAWAVEGNVISADFNMQTWEGACQDIEAVSDIDLIDPFLDNHAMLRMVFPRKKVLALPEHALSRGCRCTREKVSGILGSIAPESLAEMTLDDGSVVMTCEFCSYDFVFDAAAIATLHAPADQNQA